MAELGVGILIIPQKPWTEVAKELDDYRARLPRGQRRRGAAADLRGLDLLRRDADRAAEMARRYIGGYYQTVLDHYQFAGRPPRQDQGLRVLRQDGREDHARTATDTVIDFFVNLQVWGTPEQCYEKILDIRRRTGNTHFVGVFCYAGMPWEEAERNMRLFAREVMPALQKLEQPTEPAAR